MFKRKGILHYCLVWLLFQVAEIDIMGDQRRIMAKSRTERLLRRRRRDIQDQYAECSTAASGKSANSARVGEAATRAAEREARRFICSQCCFNNIYLRARRRRIRESSLTGISHEEGLSSDDEEPPSQRIIDDETISKETIFMLDITFLEESNIALDNIFIDAQDDYGSLRKVLER